MNPYPGCKTPGQLVKKLLDDRGWSQRILSIVLNVDPTIINKTIANTRRMDGDMALLLGEVFKIDPEIFLELQKSYELAMARVVSQPDPGRARRASLFGDLPVAEMIKRGWLNVESVKDVSGVEMALTKFFDAPSLDEIEILPHAAKKTHYSTGKPPPAAQIAWILRVRQIAREIIVGKYSPDALQVALPKLKALTASPEETRKVPRILAECGIRFVLVESLPSAKIDGVCFWLDNQSPVIGMSLRFDRIDNFWFVLRHEIEHVLQLHGRSDETIFVDDLEIEDEGSDEVEGVANAAAAEFCVPRKKMEGFIARKAPFFAERDILGFASTLQVHPGIVAGRLQRETKRYDRFRNHLVKVRSHIAPSAFVDGWGDIAPVEM